MYKGYIFDFDMTLIDLGLPYIAEAFQGYRSLLERVTGRSFSGYSIKELHGPFGDTYEGCMRTFAEWGVMDVPAFFRELEEIDFRLRKRMVGKAINPREDAIEFLEFLNNGERKGINSNTPRRNVMMIMDHFDLHRHFDERDVLCTRYKEENSKPSAWAIDILLESWGIERSEALQCGDGKNDIVSARDAGIHSFQVTTDGPINQEDYGAHMKGDFGFLKGRIHEMQVREKGCVFEEV